MECDQEIGELQEADSPGAHNQPTADQTQDPYYPRFTKRSSSSSIESENGRYGGYKTTLADSPKLNSPTLSNRYPTSYGPSAPADPPLDKL